MKSDTSHMFVSEEFERLVTQSQGFFWRVSRAALNHKVFIFVKSSKSTQSQILWNSLKNVNLGEVDQTIT